MGTSPFAADILRILYEWTTRRPEAELRAVYSQPDRPSGRGYKLMPPPVKTLAEKLDLPIFQPVNFKGEAERETLRALKPDVLAVASYGLILPQAVLDMAPAGPLNVHASLLPRYRGAAPIERALMNGDEESGVTLMRMEAGLDTGPMLAARSLPISPDDTAGDLHKKLAALGGAMLAETLEAMLDGQTPKAVPQDNGKASYAPKVTRADGLLDWTMPAAAVHARLRGVTPRPGGKTVFDLSGKTLEARLTPGRFGAGFAAPFSSFGTAEKPAPGAVLGLRGGALAIACGDAAYLVPELCPASRKPMPAAAFWNGYMKGAAAPRALSPGSRDGE